MADLMGRSGRAWLPETVEGWKGRVAAKPRMKRGTAELLIAGIAVAGLGYLAWTYFGPDLRRYLKIHSM